MIILFIISGLLTFNNDVVEAGFSWEEPDSYFVRKTVLFLCWYFKFVITNLSKISFPFQLWIMQKIKAETVGNGVTLCPFTISH